jgi:hypothetical protein
VLHVISGHRFEHKLHATALSPAELAAVAAFLQLNVEEFAPLMRYDLPLKVRARVMFLHSCIHAPANALHAEDAETLHCSWHCF